MCVYNLTLFRVTPPNKLLYNSYFEIILLDYIFYMLLILLLIFMLIECYLPFDL